MSLNAPDRESTAGGGLQLLRTTELTVVALFFCGQLQEPGA